MSFGLPKFNNPLQQPGVSNISTRDMSAPNVIKMAIVPVGEPFNRENQLLLNPSSITEGKSANWMKHYVPGQSDPIMQWINGTERTVSFTAYVTKDIATNPTLTENANATEWSLVIRPELEQQAQSASAFNTSAPLLQGLSNNASQAAPVGTFADGASQKYWSRSILPQLDFYRSLVLPRKNESSRFVKTPPLVELQMGTLLGNTDTVRTQKYILMNYSINITEYSPQLEPTKATVGFTFVEYIDTNRTSTEQQPVQGGPKLNKAQLDNATRALNRFGGTAA
jgi:hypothetical protein